MPAPPTRCIRASESVHEIISFEALDGPGRSDFLEDDGRPAVSRPPSESKRQRRDDERPWHYAKSVLWARLAIGRGEQSVNNLVRTTRQEEALNSNTGRGVDNQRTNFSRI